MIYPDLYSANLYLATTQEVFNNKVVPWCMQTFGVKRGKKRAWASEQSVEEKYRPFACSVHLKNNIDAIAFMAQWGELVMLRSTIQCRMKKPPKPHEIEASMDESLRTLRWMHRNVKSRWQLAMTRGTFGDNKPRFLFYFVDDDAEVAFLMVKPS